MNAATLLETLATALHQVAASGPTPDGLRGVECYDGSKGGPTPTTFDLRTKFVASYLHSRADLAHEVDFAVRCLLRGVLARLGPGASLVRLDQTADPGEHPEPATIAPGLPVYVGVTEEDGSHLATIRIPFGVEWSA